jgi:hypothetical protein
VSQNTPARAQGQVTFNTSVKISILNRLMLSMALLHSEHKPTLPMLACRKECCYGLEHGQYHVMLQNEMQDEGWGL